jgi:hypothetical protein
VLVASLRGPVLLLSWFGCFALAAWIELGAIVMTLGSHPIIGAGFPIATLGVLTAVLWRRPASPLWARLVATGSTLSAAATGCLFLVGVQALTDL